MLMTATQLVYILYYLLNITSVNPPNIIPSSEIIPAPQPGFSFPGLAITVGFNHRKDPQRDQVVKPAFDYIAPWYHSLHQYPGMSGLVIEDMYDDAFHNKYASDQVSFHPINVSTHESFVNIPHSLTRSINDQRFFTIEAVLNESTYDTNTYVVLSDCHDVTFLKNPFEFMSTVDRMTGKPQLYVGVEYMPSKGAFNWNARHWRNCFNEEMPYVTEIFSAGIIGGHISTVRKLLRKMNEMFLVVNDKADCNMNVMQKVIASEFHNTVVSGYPFHTKFKKYEQESDAYIRHK